ncbi:MAG: RagB/SusD family nutrient uptake outer membrane protein [Bacteroidota bacterium]|nr:RagB/SusD family nutrient uptake outer membrane protein [Bacteroidota bacterium]
MKKILSYTIICGALFLQATSCKKLDIAPTNKFTELNYWTSSDKAALVLNTAYSQMTSSDYFFYNEALSDNAYVGRGDASNVKTISAGQQDPSTSRFKDEWATRYAGIKTCNVFLEYVDAVPGMDETLRNRMKAECRFLRAYQYFQLTTWFGAIPLFDHDITLDGSKSISRTPQADVYAFIHKELEEIAPLLPTNLQYAASDKGRVTRGAAIALNARVYLYQGKWADVVTNCEKLIGSADNGTYGLFSTYEGLFLPDNEYNSEVILDYEYVPTYRTYSNLFDLAPLSVGARVNAMAPTQELVNDYLMTNGKAISETGSGYNEADPYTNRDPRLTATVVYHLFQWKKPDNTSQTIYIKPGSAPTEDAKKDEYVAGSNSTSTGYYLRKYYDPKSATNFASGLNLILIRYADVLLMYAEAKNELSGMTETIWNTTIKALRVRAGFTDANALNFNSSLNQDQLRTVIRRERRSELAMEGLRIFDILRWKTAETVLNGYPHGAKYGDASIDNGYIRLEARVFDPNKHYLWPVPQFERDQNSNLGQNPGWGQ